METILENVPTETDPEINSLLIFNHNDPISEMQEVNSANATAKTATSKDGHVRRNSTGNIGVPYKSVKILSRYLATTTTSCHDQCKYGIRQDLDPNTFGSPTLKTIAEKHIGKKKSGVGFPPSSPRSPKPESPVSSPKGNLFKKFSVPLRGLVPRSKSSLSKLSVSSNEDHSESKGIGTRVRYIDVLATPRSSRKQTIRNGKEEKTTKLNSPSSNLHSVEKRLTRRVVSLDPKNVEKKHTTPRTNKLKSVKTVDKEENQLPTNSTSQGQENNMEKRSMNSEAEKNKAKRDRIVKEKDQDLAARKLNFRRGKVTENQAANAPPRRLKFKQRSLSDTLVIDVEKIENNLKSREIGADDAEIDGANSESEKVVLKHQEGDQDKKGPQNLLNNVIEETASKLAETKKSKVKVLVGAFESVISLQDAKPAASTVDLVV